MRSLDEIAIATGTDKNSQCHNYTPYYKLFFEPMRHLPIKVLEVGIYHGDSLRLWKEYFPNATIYGVDIEDCSQHNEDRIITDITDQSSGYSLSMFKARFPSMDIIIDDGSHQCKDQILTFEKLWSSLNSGGFYVCEDLLCSYFGQWSKDGVSMISRVKQMVDEVNMGGKVNQNWLCSNKVNEREKYSLNAFEREIEFVFNSCGLVIVKKL